MRNLIRLGFFVAIAIGISSCVTTHPNEKLLAGSWNPVKAEQYFTEDELEEIENIQSQSTQQKLASSPTTSQTTGTTTPTTSTTSSQRKRGNKGDQGDLKMNLNRLIRAEERAQIIISPDKSLAKFYHKKTIKATWKLRGNGTKFMVKDIENKDRYRIDILEITESKMVVVENLPIGGIKITYKKVPE